MPTTRFFALLLLGSLALTAGYAALVLCSASWAYARSLDQLFPYYGWHIRAFSAADWQRAQRALTGLALGLAAAWLALGPASAAGRRELAATGRAAGQLLRGARRRWRALRPTQRRWFWAHLAVLSAVRLYLSLTTPWGDDAVSFEFFVRQRLLAVAAYYPLPNNHILPNTLAWGFYQLHPGFWWAMRLPVLLASTLGTGLLFGSMLRRLGYWPALLAAGAMSWGQLSLYYAALGRGYWLVTLLAGLLFAALLALLDEPEPAGPPRLAWLGLVAATLLGAYVVPTFAYVLGSAYSWLGLRAAGRRRWPLLGWGALVGLGAGLGIGLLYAPTLYVSGPAALLANPFVRPLPLGAFARALPAHAWYAEGYLLGQRSVGAAATLLGLGLFGGLLRRARAGQLSPALARQVRQVGLPALWFVLFPYLLLLAQRVLAPERTLLYKAWFFLLLLSLVLAGSRAARRRRGLLAAGLGLLAAYQVGGQLRLNYLARRADAPRRAVYEWLARHPGAGPVLIPDVYLWNWLRLKTHVEAPTQRWLPDYQPRPGVAYAYTITGPGAPHPAGRLVLARGPLRITRLVRPAVLAPGFRLPY